MGRITEWWKNFLERLAEASKQEYGDKPPSCCDSKEKVAEKTHNARYKTQAK